MIVILVKEVQLVVVVDDLGMAPLIELQIKTWKI
jgi:hypothetical protein